MEQRPQTDSMSAHAADVQALSVAEIADGRDIVKRRRFALEKIPPEDADLTAAWRYWESLRKQGLLPSRKDIDVLKLRPLASKIHLVDVSRDDPPRFRFRLYGSGIPLDSFRNYKDLVIDDYPSEAYRTALKEDYNAVYFTGVPCYQQVVARIDYVGHSYSRLIAPLADDGRRVDTLMVCIRLRKFDDLTV